MRQERCDGVLDRHADAADMGPHRALSRAQSGLGSFDQDLVETRVGINQEKLRCAGWEHDLIDLAAEGDFRAQNACDASSALFPMVDQGNTHRRELSSR